MQSVGCKIDEYAVRARRSARMTSLSKAFSEIAIGLSGVPIKNPEIDPSLLGYDRIALSYSETRNKYVGPFNRHFVSSVPFSLEEQCRLGSALHQYCETTNKNTVYTLGDGAGVTARALTDFSRGRVFTLNCSPTAANRMHFLSNCPKNASFFLGPFVDLTPERRISIAGGVFDSGFDVIIEDTTFQMYGCERAEPVALTKRHLKSDGILILTEKMAQHDLQEFRKREQLKDDVFKSQYFKEKDISLKRTTILSTMDHQLVTLKELTDVILKKFAHAVVLWNSGNFYSVAASDSIYNLSALVGIMLPPAVPQEFLHELLPRTLGSTNNFGVFRSPIR